MNIFPNKSKKIIFDACIFMVEISEQKDSFEVIKKVFIDSCFEYFDKILIHEIVYNDELDENSKKYIDDKIKIGKAEIIKAPKRDLIYESYLAELENHELLKSCYRRKNQGEIHSLAYSELHKIPYFSTNDRDAATACKELKTFQDIEIIGLEVLLVIAETILNPEDSKKTRKIRRSIYKKYCKRKGLPNTYSGYCEKFTEDKA
ncbi:MAG: hypothetical protein ACPKNR_03600 [Pleomorphochaeta sp.]